MHISHSSLIDGHVNLNTHGMKPLFNQAAVAITGTPSVVITPVGNGIRFTDSDRVSYTFPVSEPWSCPFDINECTTGLILSFWFRWEYVISSYYRNHITLGKSFHVIRPPNEIDNWIALRWKVGREFSWYNGYALVPDQWHLVMWMLNHTHSVSYLDGLKSKARRKETQVRDSAIEIVNELHFNTNLNAGGVSVGQIQLWSGRKSPVFMWRLYHEGLPDHND